MNVKSENNSFLLSRSNQVKRLVFDGVFAALGVVLMLLIRIPLLPAAPWLLYEAGDIPAIIGGLIVGPVHGLLILLVICLVQMVTPNSWGIYGLVMHLTSTGVLVLLSSIAWNRTRRQAPLIIALVAGALLMTAIMIPMNLWITPLLFKMPVEEVIKMIVPVLLPFNLLKGGINVAASYLVFRGLKGLLPHMAKHFG